MSSHITWQDHWLWRRESISAEMKTRTTIDQLTIMCYLWEVNRLNENHQSKSRWFCRVSRSSIWVRSSAIINVIWARELLNEMSIDDTVSNSSIVIYANNQRAIKLINNSIFQKRTKHIVVKYHYIRNLISQKKMKLQYRLTAKMLADGLIKLLESIQFKRFINQLNMTIKERSIWWMKTKVI
jgi:hypothetical protein